MDTLWQGDKMEKKSALIISCLLLTMLIAAMPRIQPVHAQTTTNVKIMSDITELGPDDATGTTFKVNCTVENVTNLYGVDIQINWTTEYIEYVSHIKTIPRNTYPKGILYSPTIPVKNDVDETASMPGSAPGTMYWLAEASMLPAWKFNGTGTAFEMTFRVKNHPMFVDSYIIIQITSSTLADHLGNPMEHNKINCTILLHGRPQPPGPEIHISSVSYKGTVPYTFDIDISILGLDAYWDLGGYDIQLGYDPELMQATSISVDPDGWFASFWNETLVVMQNIDNTQGKVWVALLGIPGANGTHTEPYGDATLFRVTFTAYASGPIQKIYDPFSLAAFPHPERPEPPFNNSDYSVPIPFTVTEGFANIIGITDHTPLPGYTVTTESNSYIPSIWFEPGVPMLLFNVTGAEGYSGYCNVTIPKSFMWSESIDKWFVLIDGLKITPTITEDAQNTYVYFTYKHSTHYVTIVTSYAVPEFSLAGISVILLMSLLTIAVINKRRQGKKK